VVRWAVLVAVAVVDGLSETALLLWAWMVGCTAGLEALLHCNENPIYVFLEKELRRLSPYFHIHVSVSDLYNPKIVPHIFLQQNRRQTDHGNI
jgi:hypothetical protein